MLLFLAEEPTPLNEKDGMFQRLSGLMSSFWMSRVTPCRLNET